MAGNFFRVTFAGREKSAVRTKGLWNEPKGEVRYFPARRIAIRTITGCGVRVERFHISSQALRNVRSVSVSINAIIRSLV